MNNNPPATVAVPMPAAMAGLTGDFDSVRAVLAGLGLDLATGGMFVDTVMGCDHPSMMGDRPDRIASDLCGSHVLQESLDHLSTPPAGAPPAETLQTIALYHVAEFCKAQVDHELAIIRTNIRTALSEIDVDSKFRTVYSALDDSENAALQAQASWTDLVQVGVSNRVESKIQQQQLVAELRSFIDTKVSKFQDRENVKTGIVSLRARYQHIRTGPLAEQPPCQSHSFRTFRWGWGTDVFACAWGSMHTHSQCKSPLIGRIIVAVPDAAIVARSALGTCSTLPRGSLGRPL